MVGKKGHSGGRRPGAGRKPGTTAIKKKGTAKTTKMAKATAPEPSMASVNLLKTFVMKKAAAASAPHVRCRNPRAVSAPSPWLVPASASGLLLFFFACPFTS